MAPPQAIEATHPLPEATVITVMTAVYNAGAAAMLFVPVQSSSLFNWIYMAGQLSITLLLTFGLRERFVRYGVDTGVALKKEPGGPEEGGSGVER